MAVNINIPSEVTQTITDGVTTTAPSENAVFDALALKANSADLALVATSGDYDDLNNLPVIPDVSGLVPYTGATGDVDLGLNSLSTEKVFLYDAPNDNFGSVHFTDGNFHIEDADGHPLIVVEDGFVQIHKSATIQSNLYTSGLTAIRDHYLPDASGTIALTSNIPTVDATPTDGSANAVSSNGVFDGLGTKQATLVSGTNIKTINSTTILGSGNFSVIPTHDGATYDTNALQTVTAAEYAALTPNASTIYFIV
jgi:hypothetical protein